MKAVLTITFLLLVGVIGVKLSFAYADKLTIQSSIESVNEQKKLTDYTQSLVTDMFISEVNKNGIHYLKAENFRVELDAENKEVVVSVIYMLPMNFLGVIEYPLSMSIGKLYLRD